MFGVGEMILCIIVIFRKIARIVFPDTELGRVRVSYCYINKVYKVYNILLIKLF